MPTFDFQCRKCDAVFEFSRPFGNDEHPPCPACGSKRTEKLLTPPSIQFKGSGFYKTDSAKSVQKTKKDTVKPDTAVSSTPSDKKAAPPGAASDAT